ncbi:deaminase domain-containing protein [Burkholderia perseverans]|uniref:deaminase domain-containing protein n=1 Tax=Burkholderia perseverans TaxID=2615214 RepID=UPI001FED8FB0|nr:deaminase domain-containing protein [Burkholderia perseverans]
MDTIASILNADLARFRQYIPANAAFPGNIGVFRFVPDETTSFAQPPDAPYSFGADVFGERVFGASFMIYDAIREGVRDDFAEGCTIVTNAVTGTDDDDNPLGYVIYEHEIKPVEGESASLVDEYYPAATARRIYDSEYLLANYVQREIDRRHLSSGVWHLLTELPPCKSCVGVLDGFLNGNGGVYLRVYHLKPGNQSTGNFAPLAATNRATLQLI